MAGLRIRAVGLSEIAAHPYLSLDPNDYLDEGDEVEAATATKFDPQAATRRAQEAVGLRAADLQAQVLAEADRASEAGRAYAEHLATGGHPWQTPTIQGSMRWRDRGEIISPYYGLIPVYQAWNEARGSTNPLLPFADANAWQVAERFYEALGTPLAYAEFGTTSGGVQKVSPSALQDLLRKVASEDETVVPRRTKIGGKVAYYLRPRRDGDEQVNDGRYRGDIPEEATDGG